jgi:hypothetical protein
LVSRSSTNASRNCMNVPTSTNTEITHCMATNRSPVHRQPLERA